MIIAMLQKIQDKCPLKYAVARFASSISPSQMVGQKEKCDDSFCRLVDKLYENLPCEFIKLPTATKDLLKSS